MKSRTRALSRARRVVTAAVAAGLAVVIAAPLVGAATPKTKRISLTPSGQQAVGGWNFRASTSKNGRYVAYTTAASNMAPGDNGDWNDVYIHDQKKRTRTWVSFPKSAGDNDGDSFSGDVSSDGRFVAFSSESAKIIDSDTNGFSDVFIHDTAKRRSKRVSVTSKERQAVNGDSVAPVLDASGRFVAFTSKATNLVKGDTNDKADVFVRDRKSGKTKRVSVKSNGKQARGGDSFNAAISSNGRYVAFTSEAANLARKDKNGRVDVYIHDRWTGKTSLVSVNRKGVAGDSVSDHASLSANGRYVAFASLSSDLVKKDKSPRYDVFVRDRSLGKTSLVGRRSDGRQPNGSTWFPSISANGRWVAFESYADNLFLGDTNDDADIFVRDRKTRKLRHQSRSHVGSVALGKSAVPDLSADGRFVVFRSSAADLISPGTDTNGLSDIFRRGPLR
jgi:Tol biopolymer transport system component